MPTHVANQAKASFGISAPKRVKTSRVSSAITFIFAVVGLLTPTLHAQSSPGLIAGREFNAATGSAQANAAPKGEVAQYRFASSRIFPGTSRDYWVYVPASYDPASPACVFVCQDGLQFDAPTVFDREIAAGEMPVTIGVFVMPGQLEARTEKEADRLNRSFEYEGLGDDYARFLLEELLPEVATKRTRDGRAIHLSSNGNDRAIAGQGAGGTCALNAAWERPDAFSRVFSARGVFTGLRGGNNSATLVRKFEPKPIRVFLQNDTSNTETFAGDASLANQEMLRALTFAGYEVRHAWGEGAREDRHAREVFPDAIKWLWSGWPGPVKRGNGSRELQEILIPGEDWQLVGEGYQFTEGPTTDRHGTVFFNDIPNNKTYRVSADGIPIVVNAATNGSNGMAFGPDGRRYVAATGAKQILAFDPDYRPAVIADDLPGNDLVVLRNGDIYVTNPVSKHDPGTVWLVRPGGQKRIVDTGIIFPNGVTASPDQSLLFVTECHSHWVWSFQIQPDGTLLHKQRYFHLHVPDGFDSSGADGMRVDRDGRLFVTTRIGIQVCDREGRVTCIIPTPNGKVYNVTFGGPHFDILYATAADKVYRRKVRTVGANAWDEPKKPDASLPR